MISSISLFEILFSFSNFFFFVWKTFFLIVASVADADAVNHSGIKTLSANRLNTACFARLRTHIMTCLACLPTHVPMCFAYLCARVTMCLAYSRAHVLMCLRCLHANVPLRAYALMCYNFKYQKYVFNDMFSSDVRYFFFSFSCEMKLYLKVHEKEGCL